MGYVQRRASNETPQVSVGSIQQTITQVHGPKEVSTRIQTIVALQIDIPSTVCISGVVPQKVLPPIRVIIHMQHHLDSQTLSIAYQPSINHAAIIIIPRQHRVPSHPHV